MKLKPIFYGQVENGKLKLKDHDQLKAYLHTLKGEVMVSIDKRHKKRSDRENRYYWGVVIPLLCEHTGYTDEEMHEAIKWEFLKKHGVKIPTVRSTTTLSTVEFEDLMSRVRQWASLTLGVYIPNPNEIL